jgi:hypothetical protein
MIDSGIMALTFEKLRTKAHATAHSPACARGSVDAYEHVYGRRDPHCPRCKMDDRARNMAAKKLFG